MSNSLFFTGTDTDVGKTVICSGIASAIRNLGINVGIMKPFAAGTPQKSGYKSKDVHILSNAAQVKDPEELVNPYFFPIPASPFTAAKSLGIKIDIKNVMKSFQSLLDIHDVLLVEGIGGIMTPILKNYFVTNLINEMNLKTIIVTSSQIGTVNHTLLTINCCHNFGVKIEGIIINDFGTNCYPVNELKTNLEELTDEKILGIIPKLDNFEFTNVLQSITDNIDIKSLTEK